MRFADAAANHVQRVCTRRPKNRNMKRLTAILLITLCWNQVTAQTTPDDTLNSYRFRTSVSYDLPHFWRNMRGKDPVGPVQLDAHYFLGKNFALGFNYGGSRELHSTTRHHLIQDSLFVAQYDGRIKTTQYMVDGMYYLNFLNAESDFLKNWRIYTSFGLGIGIAKAEYQLQNQVPGALEDISETEYYLARHLSLGAEYRFHNRFGLYFESGIGISRLQFGAFFNF